MSPRKPSVLCVVSILISLTIVPPSSQATHVGDALINPLHMNQDTANRQVVTYNQVLHVVTSYYLRVCTQWQGLNCVEYVHYYDWRVASGWVQRRFDEWYQYQDSGLAWAFLVQQHRNVQVSFGNNDRQNGGNFVYYYYCPRDGSVDGSNNVGFSYGVDGTPNIGGGRVVARYDIPTRMTNHVYRSSGTYLYNSVYATEQFSFGDSTSWRWAPVCNAARHHLGQSGWEVRIETWSESLRVACCYRILRYNDYTDFRMQF